MEHAASRNCICIPGLAAFGCSNALQLLPWREVPLLGSHLVAPVVAIKIDRPESSIRLDVGRRVVQRVLAAQLFLDLSKAVGGFLDRRRGKIGRANV